MTLIVAWRDPFCLISDSAMTMGVYGTQHQVPPKIRRLSTTIAAGGSGIDLMQGSLLDRIGAIEADDWPSMSAQVAAIVNEINGRAHHPIAYVSAVVAGTIRGQRGIIEWGADPREQTPEELASGNTHCTVGTGGQCADIVKAAASWWEPELGGEKLLETMAEVAAKVDIGTSKPIWRIDLEGEVTEPYVWLP
jgi:hypothetical protein